MTPYASTWPLGKDFTGTAASLHGNASPQYGLQLTGLQAAPGDNSFTRTRTAHPQGVEMRARKKIFDYVAQRNLAAQFFVYRPTSVELGPKSNFGVSHDARVTPSGAATNLCASL